MMERDLGRLACLVGRLDSFRNVMKRPSGRTCHHPLLCLLAFDVQCLDMVE